MHDVAAAAGWRWVTPTLAAVFRRRLCLVLPHSSRYLTGDSGHHQFLFLLVSSSTQAGLRLPAAATAVSLAVSGHYMEHRIGPKFQNYNLRACLTTIPETLTLNDYNNNSWGIYYQSLSNPKQNPQFENKICKIVTIFIWSFLLIQSSGFSYSHISVDHSNTSECLRVRVKPPFVVSGYCGKGTSRISCFFPTDTGKIVQFP